MLRILVVIPLLALVARGQAPSPWATLHVPTGVVPSQAASQGKIVAYRDGGTLHAWSAVTRQWASTPVGSQPVLRLQNDCLLSQDANQWVAFSAYRGRFEPLAVGPTATLQNATSATNDSLLLVADGGQLHAFSAFVGTWTSRPLAGAFQTAVQRHVAILAQGTLLSGLDAATGQWHDHVAAAPPTLVSADGTAAFAWGGGTVHAFSASHTSWRDTAELPGAAFVRADDWGLWYSPGRLLGYSAIRGEFATSPRVVSTIVATQDLFVLGDGPGGVLAFSALTGTFSLPLAAPGAAVTSSTAVALLGDAAGIRGYSAVHNRAALHANPGPNAGAANVVGWVGSGATSGPPWFFSALTCQWYEAPPSVLPGDPVLTTTSAGALTNAGCTAFAPRSGTFVPLGDPTIVLAGNPSSAPLVAIGSTSLHAFEARSERWITTPRAGNGPIAPQIWRTGALLQDGATAFAFGAQAGSWSAQALTGPVTGLRANSESVRINTAQDVVAWSAVGEVGWLAQFPEFRRVQPAATGLPLVVLVPPAGFAVLGIGTLAATPLPLPGLGEILLGPAGHATLLLVAPPSGEPVRVTLPVPALPPDVGREFAIQAVMLPLGGIPYASDAATVMPLGT